MFSAKHAKKTWTRKIASLVVGATAIFSASFVQLDAAKAVPNCVGTTTTYMSGLTSMTVQTFKTGGSQCQFKIPGSTTEVNILLVGAGGGGGGGASALGGRGGGGGGAGGQVHEMLIRPSGGETLLLQVGEGGLAGGGPNNVAGQLAGCGQQGGNTWIEVTISSTLTSYSVEGGHGGKAGGVDMDCTTPNTNIGGEGGWVRASNGGAPSGLQGGSGASSAGNGVAGTDAAGARAKNPGLTSNITGSSVEYAPGGGGSYQDGWGWEATAANIGGGGQGGRGSLSSSGTYTYGYAGSAGIDGAVILSYVTPTSASVTFGSSPNGTATAATSPVTIGGSTTITATPSTGYEFTSWSCTGGSLSSTTANPATLSSISSDTVCTPTFTAITPDLTVVNTPGIAWLASSSQTTYNGSFTLSATPAPGYTFTGWSCTNGTLSSLSASSVTLSNVTADTTCTPGASVQTVTVTIGSLSNGSAVVGASPVNYNTSTQLTATPDAGFLFDHWTCTAGTLSSSTANPATLSAITSNAVCTAVFVSDIPTPSIGGISPAKGSAKGGTLITITGSNFDSPTVTIDGQTCEIVTQSATQITCRVPAGTVGGADVVVDNGGGKTDTVNSGFTYVTPVEPPQRPVPSNANVTINPGSLTINMDYNGDPTFTPTGYSAYVLPGNNSCVIPQGKDSCEILGLKPGVEYTVVIRAVNSAGISQALTMPRTYLIGQKSPLKLLAKLGIRPFAGDSAAMTPAFRFQIRKFMTANPKLSAFTCTGYTAGTPVKASDKKLARARAAAVCGYIQKLRPTASVTVIGLTPGLSWSANNRKVLVKGLGLNE